MAKDLEQFIYSLPEEKQLKLALQLTTELMPIWDNFTTHSEDLHYIDTIGSTPVDVSPQLLNQALSASVSVSQASNEAEKALALEDIHMIWEKYGLHISALQNQDWEIPYPVERAVYAIYNIIEYLHGMKETMFDESTLYVAINQSIDALINTGRKEAEDVIDMLDQYGEFSN